jgi:hypothetical protein
MPDLALPIALGALLLVVLLWALTVVLPSLRRQARRLWFRTVYSRRLSPGDRPFVEEALRDGDYRSLEEAALRAAQGPTRQALLRVVFKHYLRQDRVSAWSLLFSLPPGKRSAFIGSRRLSTLMEKDIRRAVRAGALAKATQYASFLGRELTERELYTAMRKALEAGDMDAAETARRRLSRMSVPGR